MNSEAQSVKDPKGPEAHRPVVLSVAGFDPSSGAGITADLQVFNSYGLYGVAAITALTVQSTQGVWRVEPVGGKLFRHTLECLAADMPIVGVKIGMLGSAEVVRELTLFLRDAGISRSRVVLDPVLASSSGAELLEAQGVGLLPEELLPQVGWMTPNIDELGALAGEPRAAGRERVPVLARRLAKKNAGLNVVVTGGHLDSPDDFLRTATGDEKWFPGQRVETTSTHGTGCVFSSALLCRIVAGDSPMEAVRGAKEFVTRALERAVPIGKGRGPVL